MSLPNEQYRSLEITREFLRNLLDPGQRPKTVAEMKRQVLSCLRHYPNAWDLKAIVKYLDTNATCVDCGAITKPGAGSARCNDCWDSRFGQ